MDLFLADNSMVNGVLAIMGIIGAFVLVVYSLTIPLPPVTTPLDRRADEKAKQIYTRHDLWRW